MNIASSDPASLPEVSRDTVAAILAAMAEICAQDSGFPIFAEHLDGWVRLGIGDDGYNLCFRQGRIVAVTGDEGHSSGWLYEITGPKSDWVKMFVGLIDLTQAIVKPFGSTIIRGDRVRYSAEAQAMAHFTRLLPKAAAKAGIAVVSKPMPAGHDPAFTWSTKNPITGHYVDVDGVRTYYETAGDDHGKVVFLGIHTAGRDCRQWQKFADVVCGSGRFYAVDLPGHGKSWPLDGNRCLSTMDAISQFIGAFRRAVGITKPVVVLGCSVGGNLVLQLAGDYPGEVAAAISFQGADYTPTTKSPAALAMMDHPRINPAYHHIARTIDRTGHRTRQQVRDYLMWEVRCYSSISIQADLTAYGNFDYRSRMKQIRCPVLFIRGQDDWIVSETAVRESAERLVNSPKVEILLPPGVGHFSHIEQPEEHGAQVLDFLSRSGVV
ncbi:alpha/beta hydrolase [Bosea sp. (in: a-proteobacteria)]|uniref:alpha/beta fold hydrolase n=1 Tax=Bosea sp. (in: a-proteobacteria) TaxID=1871050 RepID=UPI002609C575|nr:alpha/beta hydrolase [Bosea sp. (in: a-proteobacteria)]MCO5091338.1 alpha/beta hydrolase [Bosea sp. (in: a-proteobacteria)]